MVIAGNFSDDAHPAALARAPSVSRRQGLNKYRVVWLHDGIDHGQNYGNHLQRIVRPCEIWAGDEEYEVRPMAVTAPDSGRAAMEADLLVAVQLGIAPVLQLIQRRKALGRPTVYEINDDITQVGHWIPPGSPVHGVLWRQQVLSEAHYSDALQLSSSGLAHRLETLHPDRYVLDPYVPTPATIPVKPQGFVIGWAGTSTHLDDLMPTAAVLGSFLRSHPEARFALMGEANYFRQFLDQLPAGQVETHPFGKYEALQDFLAGIHVGIAPLQDTAFNQGRSDGKVVQYAAAGAVALACDCPVFAPHASHALLFRSPQEMHGHLEALHAQPARRQALAEAAFEWVRSYRSPAAVRRFLRQQFERLLAGRPARPRLPLPSRPQALGIELDRARKLLLEKADEAALQACRRALELAPDCDEARWLALNILARRKQHAELIRLVDEAPSGDSWYSDHVALLAYRAAKAVSPSRQQEFVQRMHAFGQLYRHENDQGTGVERRHRQILAHSPYNYFSLFGLISLLHAHDPNHPELCLLLKRADLLDPQATCAFRNSP